MTFKPQLRLHSLSWLFVLANQLRSVILPLGAFLFFGVRNNPQLWGLVAIVPFVLGAAWQQWTYRYGFGPRGLVIHDGLFFRNVRQIEYPRIENIDVERGVLHRLLGVAEVKIATSTGGKPEALIRVLGLDAVQELREQIFNRERPAEAVAERQAPPVADEVLLHVPPSELIRYGLIDNRGLIVVAAFFGYLFQEGMSAFTERLIRTWVTDAHVTEFIALGIATQVAVVTSVIAIVVLALRLLSVVLALVTLHDFTLTRHQHDFRIRHGLFTRVALNLRVRRIQSVHQTETLLHRLLHRVSLSVDLAGDSGVPEGGDTRSHTRTRWLAPICSGEQAAALTATALPDADLSQPPDWQPLAPGARTRLFRRSVYIVVLLCLLLTLILHLLPEAPLSPGPWILAIAAALITIAWFRAHIYVKNTRWALTRDVILFRHGWLTRRLVVAPRNRLQSVKFSTSPFDRRYRMANVSLDTAGAGSLSTSIRIPLLPVKVALRLANALYRSRVDAVSVRTFTA
ncbi:MAG TPA: PH domain-containing protein [Povalibacter sp.]